jgi:hypothetical protein
MSIPMQTTTGTCPHGLQWPTCSVCHGQHPMQWPTAPAPMGCICPPTSEQTCQAPLCPRRGFKSVTTTNTAAMGTTDG